MDDRTRRRLAFIVAVKAGLKPTSVYSFEADRHTNMEDKGTWMIDHAARVRFSDAYDYGRKAHWQVELTGAEFTGYDHGFGHHFTGKITGRSIQIYDHGAGRYFDFSV